uniref:TSA: Wollemia nobilis Ref_Wollemi_Transcript_10175_1784 transcribed RNA sequence n=1 Tax=Wollemia nobilis TaxID=56998 RepID=A0A0C9QTT4_9CONI
MANAYSFWQFGEELRGQARASDDHKWTLAASKLALAEQMRTKGDRINRLETTGSPAEPKQRGKSKGKSDVNKLDLNFKHMNLDWKPGDTGVKGGISNGIYNSNSLLHHNNNNNNNNINHHNNNSNSNSGGNNNNSALDKRFKTLPSTEMLPRNEILGGYIFVCNNDTMQEDLKRQLFGLPQRYRDSVRAITPGLPLFLYNYTTHQLHGIFEAASFGGSNIDPTAWEDKKCKGESRFPAQVRIRVRKLCKPLEEDAFRPVLHHYDGPKFRLQLSIPETLALMDLCIQNSI